MTNFTENEVKCSPFGRRWAFLGSWVQGGPRGTDRAPEGWYPGAVPPTVIPGPCFRTTLPAGGPAPCGRCPAGPPRSKAGWLGVPVLPLPTHPYTPSPCPYPYPYTRQCTKLTVQYTVPNSHFWDTVGEPRGMGTHAGLWVPGWFMEHGLVYTAV